MPQAGRAYCAVRAGGIHRGHAQLAWGCAVAFACAVPCGARRCVVGSAACHARPRAALSARRSGARGTRSSRGGGGCGTSAVQRGVGAQLQAQDACVAASRRVGELLALQRALGAELLLGGRTGDSSAPGSSADADPAWLQLALNPRGAAVPVDEALGLLRFGFGSATRMTHVFRDHWRASAPPGAPMPAIITEMLEAESDALCYAARASAMLASLMERAPLHVYLGAAEAVLSELAAGTRGFELALGARATWTQEVLRGGIAPPPTTFADKVSSAQYFGSIMTLASTTS